MAHQFNKNRKKNLTRKKSLACPPQPQINQKKTKKKEISHFVPQSYDPDQHCKYTKIKPGQSLKQKKKGELKLKLKLKLKVKEIVENV